jgi:hypothetical protein
MKFLHTAFFLLLFANFLFAQTLQVAPVKGNPILKHHLNQKFLEDAKLVEQLSGHLPSNQLAGERGTCPPEVDGYVVESGRMIEIEIDTFGLTKGEAEATVTIENNGALQYGTANYADTTLLLTYTANGGLSGANLETIQFKVSQPGHDTTFSVEIKVRRRGRVVVAETQTVQPESISTFCLEDELAFDLPKVCAGSRDDFDNYDGRGDIFHHLSSYDYPDTCLVYYASRFPGVDTISMTICDEWGVCDLFKVPYEIPGDTLSIQSQPFFDDFSSYEDIHPTADLWLDKDVYRNATLAPNPPSIGFVSFDGLDGRGDVYNVFKGVGDRLTSKAIDLSSYTANSDIFLRFFVAAKGYGLPPEESDSLTIEFRNNQREWVRVGTFLGLKDVGMDSFPPFVFNAIPVNNTQFLHEAFQFRFTAVTSPGGISDMWHIDYVHLNKNENPTSNFNDIAITKLPTSPLKNYTALPWKHFSNHVDIETQNQLTSQFYNHFDDVLAISESKVTYHELNSGSNLTTAFPVVEGGTESNLPLQVHSDRSRAIPASNFDALKTALSNLPDGDDPKILETQYSIRPSTLQVNGFASNDTVRIQNIFSDYFAHDDGTAEWQIFIQHATGVEQFGSKFRTNVSDTLKSVQIMFPHVNGDVSNQLFNLNVWLGDFDTMIFSRPLLKPFYPDLVYDTLHGFTTYLLDDFLGTPQPVFIPANTDFYVTIQQASAASLGIPVGLDVQNPCDCNWANLDEENWVKFPSNLAGALMIRPVFGDVRATSSSNEIPVEASSVNIFPNPSKGSINFETRNGDFKDYKLYVFNSLGQLMDSGYLQQTWDLGSFPNGIYFMNIINEKSGEHQTKRIVLAKD